MKKIEKLVICVICIVAMVFFVGCNDKDGAGDSDGSTVQDGTDGSYSNGRGDKNSEGIDHEGTIGDSSNVGNSSDNKVDVWLAYWDTLGFEENIDYWSERVDDVIYFAAYFDNNNKLFVPDSISEAKQTVDTLYKNEDWGNYISFVNDKIDANGKSILKDTELLYSLFESVESMDAHIDDIINITVQGGYKGIEIDYEKIRKDIGLWEKFSVFLERLIKVADKYDFSIRVLLEPSTPVDKIELPEGPEYIMMCYNLYGYGTEPGPKANKEFLLELTDKMQDFTGIKGYALATGGFDFSGNGEAKAITKQEAENLVVKYNNEVNEIIEVRDENSKCKVFKYIDESKVEHEVWYADNVTLEYWESILRANGADRISIWKL